MTSFKQKLNRVQWWRRHEYDILRVVLFPALVIIKAKDTIQETKRDNLQWSDEKATEILNKTLPTLLETYEGALWYSLDWRVYFYEYKNIHGKDKEFAFKYNPKIRTFLIEHYQIEGYRKTIEKENYEVWIKFTKKS